jgi:hypothetical protein
MSMHIFLCVATRTVTASTATVGARPAAARQQHLGGVTGDTRTVEWGGTSRATRWVVGLTEQVDQHREAEVAVADGVQSMVEAAIGRRQSGRFPVTPWMRGKHERWPESKRGGARVELTKRGEIKSTYANSGRRAENEIEITTGLFSREEHRILGM